ncbi:MAG: glycosyltransferase [Alphaproteobacteria bacterium]|nr:glycosyltransferase [Alphaproteobacteria bacterium]
MIQLTPPDSSDRNLSVILPTFNESLNIVTLITLIKAVIPPGWKAEILVVDDNSPDGTYDLVRRTFEDDGSVRPILRTTDRGFAKSIRCGITQAKFDRIIVMDSDLTHDPADIPRLLHVGMIFDLVSGSRFAAGGSMADIGHYVASMLYNWMLRLILRTQLQDNLGGYFSASRAKIMALPVDEIFFGYGEYYFRLLYFAQRAGYSVIEIPSKYLPRGRGTSKSTWVKMVTNYTCAAMRLRWRGRNLSVATDASTHDLRRPTKMRTGHET